jgi:putative transposase
MSIKKTMVDPDDPDLSINKQCQLLDVPRSSFYFKARGENELNLKLMNRIDEVYTEHPTWGSRKIRDYLRNEGYKVNRKRLQRLMHTMGIAAIYPQKKISIPHPDYKIYPYLLRGLDICRSNQVWCTDITYIRLKHGFVFLTAIMDWYSRKILSWELSVTIDKYFCIEALESALRHFGKPEIFNSDQGSQFTSPSFTGILKENNIRISMDGKGRALDNVMIERFWRTLKYDEVYLKEYESVTDARRQIGAFIEMYNSKRPHASLNGLTPNSVYNANLKKDAA